MLQYMGGRGYVEFGCDWNSMFSKTTREKFLLFRPDDSGSVHGRCSLSAIT
ncbi:MAG: hypothetical protein ACLR8Y_22200 [Alistipes indistinctus]